MIFEGARNDDIVYPRPPRRRWFWLAGLTMALSACAVPVQVTLSDAAATACKGQSAANLATDAAVALGNAKATELSAATSAYLGLLCRW